MKIKNPTKKNIGKLLLDQGATARFNHCSESNNSASATYLSDKKMIVWNCFKCHMSGGFNTAEHITTKQKEKRTLDSKDIVWNFINAPAEVIKYCYQNKLLYWNDIGYHPFTSRVIFKVPGNDMFLSRDVLGSGAVPKWLTYGELKNPPVYKARDWGSTLIIVEDILSAIHVSRNVSMMYNVMPLLGTSLKKEFVSLVLKYTNILIWLDSDKPGINAAKKIYENLFSQANSAAKIYTIASLDDPKKLSEQQLEQLDFGKGFFYYDNQRDTFTIFSSFPEWVRGVEKELGSR